MTYTIADSLNVQGAIVATGGVNQSSVTTNIVAAGTVQANATALTTTLNLLGNVAAGTGVALTASPAGASGQSVRVINGNTTQVQVYAFAAETGNTTINGILGNIGVALYGGSACTFQQTSAGVWWGIADGSIGGVNVANATAGNFTLTAANMTGADTTVVLNLSAGSGNVVATLPTVAVVLGNMQVPSASSSYVWRVINSSGSAGNWTLGNATGWSIFGTTTVNQNTFRDFLISVTSVSTPTASIRSIGTGTNS